MKKILLTLILSFMICNLQAQRYVYALPEGNKVKYEAEEINICFADVVKEPASQKGSESYEIAPMAAVALASVVPALVKVGFQWGDSLFAKKVRKYKAEYVRFQSYLGAANRKMPDFRFQRKIGLSGGTEKVALEISFKAEYIAGFENAAMVYYIDKTILNYVSAQTEANEKPDYVITLKPVFYLSGSGQKETREIIPLAMHSVRPGECNDYDDKRYRTEIILLPKDAHLLGMMVSVAESNPRIVKAEEYLANWNAYKNSAKTEIVDPLVSQLLKHVQDQAADDNQWKIALSKNNKESYEEYLKLYPIGRHSDEAKAKINELSNNKKSGGDDVRQD